MHLQVYIDLLIIIYRTEFEKFGLTNKSVPIIHLHVFFLDTIRVSQEVAVIIELH